MAWFHDVGQDMIGDREPTLYFWRAVVIVILFIAFAILVRLFWRTTSTRIEKTEPSRDWSDSYDPAIKDRVEERVLRIDEHNDV
jgi:hypothetical protein